MLTDSGAIHSLGIRLEPLRPFGCQLRFVFRPPMWFGAWLGVPSSVQFGCGLPGCVPGGVGVGGPLLVPGVVGFEVLAFGGQLGGESGGAGRAGLIMQGVGLGGLLAGVRFGLGGEPELAADVGRGGGAGALALKSSYFEFDRGPGRG